MNYYFKNKDSSMYIVCDRITVQDDSLNLYKNGEYIGMISLAISRLECTEASKNMKWYIVSNKHERVYPSNK